MNIVFTFLLAILIPSISIAADSCSNKGGDLSPYSKWEGKEHEPIMEEISAAISPMHKDILKYFHCLKQCKNVHLIDYKGINSHCRKPCFTMRVHKLVDFDEARLFFVHITESLLYILNTNPCSMKCYTPKDICVRIFFSHFVGYIDPLYIHRIDLDNGKVTYDPFNRDNLRMLTDRQCEHYEVSLHRAKLQCTACCLCEDPCCMFCKEVQYTTLEDECLMKPVETDEKNLQDFLETLEDNRRQRPTKQDRSKPISQRTMNMHKELGVGVQEEKVGQKKVKRSPFKRVTKKRTLRG